MKVVLVLFIALGALALAEAYSTTTLTPCPGRCPPFLLYVCAKDKHGNVYKFINGCYMRRCACKMWLEAVPMSECPLDAPGCPLRDLSDAAITEEDSSEEAASELPQGAARSLRDDLSAFDASQEDFHLQRNQLRVKFH